MSKANRREKILVTGGAGYIGSHVCVELLNNHYDVVVVDNLSNGSEIALQRVMAITDQPLTFINGDIRDTAVLDALFREHAIAAVVHLAGLKAVGESCRIPLAYYHNNVYGTLTLCEAMNKANVKQLVFSSSATVYGEPNKLPIAENFPRSATNPYGHSKLIIEDILEHLHASDPRWCIALLRYFNPAGAHPSGKIGEAPNDIPNNLLPYVTQTAIGKLKELKVFGNDYPTHDGTGVRDYIHVVDLALGHVRAIAALQGNAGVHAWNLGVGKGYSVLDIIAAFKRTSGIKIPYTVVDRRSGDIAACYAQPDKALRELDWQAEKSLDDMVTDAWRWQQQNPNGYDG